MRVGGRSRWKSFVTWGKGSGALRVVTQLGDLTCLQLLGIQAVIN